MANHTRSGNPGSPKVSFGALLKAAFEPAWLAAVDEVEDTMQEHNELWQDSFGNEGMIAGEAGGRGSAPPLAEKTIERKEAGGMANPYLMLYDTTLYNETGEEDPAQLINSLGTDGPHLTMDEEALRAKVHGTSYINHATFPLNEFGIGVPMRQTLRPTDEDVSVHFEAHAMERIGRAIKQGVKDHLEGVKQ